MSVGTSGIFELIDRERGRQDRLQAQGKFRYTIADSRIGHDRRLSILTEEVGEVAKRLNQLELLTHVHYDPELVAELVQVAACAVGWLESLGFPRHGA